MSIIEEVGKVCATKYLETNRVPTKVYLPIEKYKQMLLEMRHSLQMPEPEMVPGEFGWRLETAAEYTARVERITKFPITISLTLTTGTLTLVPSTKTEIEVTLEEN
jgi:hypothetical protein